MKESHYEIIKLLVQRELDEIKNDVEESDENYTKNLEEILEEIGKWAGNYQVEQIILKTL